MFARHQFGTKSNVAMPQIPSTATISSIGNIHFVKCNEFIVLVRVFLVSIDQISMVLAPETAQVMISCSTRKSLKSESRKTVPNRQKK